MPANIAAASSAELRALIAWLTFFVLLGVFIALGHVWLRLKVVDLGYRLLQLVADFISRPDFLAGHPDLARTLLAEMDSEHQRDAPAIAGILKSAERIRTAWTAENDKRRAPEGNGADASS